MQISFTEAAAHEIARKLGDDKDARLKLVFDSEGCGCSANGVPTLWIVSEAGTYDFIADGEPYDVLIDRKHEVYFEERMIVDYIPQGIRFVLKSGGQIYNSFMHLIDRRETVQQA